MWTKNFLFFYLSVSGVMEKVRHIVFCLHGIGYFSYVTLLQLHERNN